VVPDVLIVNGKPPLTPKSKLMFPPPVEVRVVALPSVTPVLYACAPLVTTLPPPIRADDEKVDSFKVRLASGVIPPTAPPRVTVPALAVKARPPSTVEGNAIFPLPVERSVVSAVKVTGPFQFCAPVVTAPPPIMIGPPLTESEVSAVEPPTAPPKVVVPV